LTHNKLANGKLGNTKFAHVPFLSPTEEARPSFREIKMAQHSHSCLAKAIMATTFSNAKDPASKRDNCGISF
jgi:hypothetical protein